MSNRPERLHDVDELDVQHLLAGYRLNVNQATKREAIARMTARGDSPEQIANALDTNEQAVRKTIDRLIQRNGGNRAVVHTLDTRVSATANRADRVMHNWHNHHDLDQLAKSAKDMRDRYDEIARDAIAKLRAMRGRSA